MTFYTTRKGTFGEETFGDTCTPEWKPSYLSQSGFEPLTYHILLHLNMTSQEGQNVFKYTSVTREQRVTKDVLTL